MEPESSCRPGKREVDKCKGQGKLAPPSLNVPRIENEVEDEFGVLRETVEEQKETIEDLVSELEEERDAYSLAAKESMSTVLRLQREKAEVQREVRQLKRSAKRKMARHQQEVLAFKDQLNKREQTIHSLTTQIRLKKEQEDKEDERQFKAQPHLYTIIKVAREEDLREQVGKDIYFDLVAHDKVQSFRIQKRMAFNLFKEKVAKEFGIPVDFQRFWLCVKRQNHTLRPHRPVTPQEETQTVGQLKDFFTNTPNAELKLFLEVEIGQDLRPIPPPEISKEDILIFCKLYDPHKEELQYVGRLFVKSFGKPSEILTILNRMAGFASDEEIELFEEIHFEPKLRCELLEKRASFRSSQIENGDIICFQKRPKPETEQEMRFADVPSFLENVKNQQNLQTIAKPVKR